MRAPSRSSACAAFSSTRPATSTSSSALNAFAEVVRVDLDRTRAVEAAPSDTSYADQWSLPQVGWDQLYGTVGIAGTSTVAVLDTGVDATHPDLDGVVLPGTSVLDGSNGLSDPNGHGTWMAGIVAAETDNGIGIAGTAYAGVSVLPVTVLGADGTGQDSDIIAGVVYAADAGADVILMSFSNPGYSPALQAAIDYAWDSRRRPRRRHRQRRLRAPPPSRPATAASSASPPPIPSTPSPLGANYGPAAFMAAPGVDIATTSCWGGVATISGTSAAAAEVAGAAALLSANEPAPLERRHRRRASRAPPIRPATRPRPATAASTWPAPWPMPRPIRSSPPALRPLGRRPARRAICRGRCGGTGRCPVRSRRTYCHPSGATNATTRAVAQSRPR